MTHLTSPYKGRDRRAAELMTQHPHAAELLMLYRVVLAYQEPIFDWVRATKWRLGVLPAAGSAALRLAELPFPRLVSRFRHFTGELASNATEVLAAGGWAIAKASKEQRARLLQTTVTAGDLEALASSLDTEPALLVFFGRAFLQPIAEALAAEADEIGDTSAAASAATDDGDSGSVGTAQPAEGTVDGGAGCPRCGWPPQVALLRDEAHLTSGRVLVCSLCASQWSAPRLACAACGESDSEQLRCREDESRPYLRLDECQICKAYLKTFDLRRNATVVPLVDDIATIELDLWAAEQGLEKICPNLLGQ